jgi:hypothetical protein
MTEKVLDNGSPSPRILILILPFAFGVVILYKLWPLLLLLAALIIGVKIWDNYRWQKWCREINPYFNQLIKENRGNLTPIDLSVKANLTARAAKEFLNRKSEEYGVTPKTLQDKGVVYYFPTASALGSIFDDSEPALNSYQLAAKDSNKFSVRGIAQLAKQEQNQEQNQNNETKITESSPVAQLTKEESVLKTEPETQVFETETNEAVSIDAGHSLIQAELAKRLDLNSSTVGRRKSEPDFEEWSRSKDPEGVAWKYEPDTKMYVAVISN